MKKSMKALVVLLALAAAATPALAENRLSLSGEMRVRAATMDTAETGYEAADFFDQRLRLGGKLAVAEGVSVNFRFDATEGTWGADGNKDSNRFKSIHWDQANLAIDKEKFSLVAGQQYFGLGNAIVVDNIGTGLTATLKGQVPVTVTFNRLGETGNNDSDSSLYTVNVGHKTDAYSANLFFARLSDNTGYLVSDGDLTWSSPLLGVPASAVELINNNYDFFGGDITDAEVSSKAEVNAIGLTYDSQFGAVALKAEADYFFGNATLLGEADVWDDVLNDYVDEELRADLDVKGLQLYVDGSTKLNDNTKVGVMGFYAQGTDLLDGELQMTQLSDWQDWDPTTYGAMTCDFSILPNHSYEVFDFTGTSSGVIGGSIYGDFQVSKDLLVQASFFYLTPETDENMDALGLEIDSTMGGNLSATYNLFENTALSIHGAYSKTDGDLANYGEIASVDLNAGPAVLSDLIETNPEMYVVMGKLAVNF